MSVDGTPREKGIYEASLVLASDPEFSDDIFTIEWPAGAHIVDGTVAVFDAGWRVLLVVLLILAAPLLLVWRQQRRRSSEVS